MPRTSARDRRLNPGWWTLILIVALIALVLVCSGFYFGTFSSSIPVTLVSDRAGLVMESGARVKLRGVSVGRVATVDFAANRSSLRLELDPDQSKRIPANVQAEIKATTVFGAKYVELIYPEHPSGARLTAGAVLQSRNVTTEVNTVFQNLVGVLRQVDVSKLNATLTALAQAVRGQGERIGEATSAANEVLTAINPRMDTLAQDWRSIDGFSVAYSAAAQNILTILDMASTTSATVTDHAKALDSLLLSTIGFGQAGVDLLEPNEDGLARTVKVLEPTTGLLHKYSPTFTCMLLGAKWILDNGAYDTMGGGDGKSLVLDAALAFGDDPYRYPDNLPIVAAKGGPGGKPGCGSLPDVTKNFPVRQLVTNTGWGTGLDIRPNPGIGHPWWVNFFPVTRAVPEPPSIRGQGPPAIGPVPYPGAPPYGDLQYGPDGTPLYPGVPPVPPPAAPSAPENP